MSCKANPEKTSALLPFNSIDNRRIVFADSSAGILANNARQLKSSKLFPKGIVSYILPDFS